MNYYKYDKEIKVRYSQFDTSSLQELIYEIYNLKEITKCNLYDFGMNDIYYIEADGKKYYLRISQTGFHTWKDYDEETSIINQLSEYEILVATPVRIKNGDYLWKINAPEGSRYGILFNEAKNLPSEDNITQVFNLGCELAKIHNIADSHEFIVSREPIDLNHLIQKSIYMLKPYLKHRKEDLEFLIKSSSQLGDFIQSKLSKEKPFYGYCHGDIHSGNVFFNHHQPIIFDFDCMGYGWRAYDICVYAWNKTFSDEDYIYKKEWEAFLNGYNTIRQLSKNEMETIHAFAALRELWMMGLHADVMYRNAGCSWFNDSYFNYQIGIYKLWYDRVFKKKESISYF